MDHDDSMLSASSSPAEDETFAEEEDDLFPESASMVNRAQTPQNDHLNAAAPGELSPPRSQHTGTKVRTDTGGGGAGVSDGLGMDADADLSPTTPNLAKMAKSRGLLNANPGERGDKEEWKPGQAWKTKKAQEEMSRTWDNFVDKDFNIRQFGDVLAPSGVGPHQQPPPPLPPTQQE